MSEFRTCDGLRACGRRIPAETFNTPSAHAPGCSRRLSMLAKANAAKRRAKADRAAERAAAREAKRKGMTLTEFNRTDAERERGS